MSEPLVKANRRDFLKTVVAGTAAIDSRNNSPGDVYMKAFTLNSAPYKEPLVAHSMIARGASLTFEKTEHH